MTKGPGANERRDGGCVCIVGEIERLREAVLVHLAETKATPSPSPACTQASFEEHRKAVDARLAALEQSKAREILPSVVFAALAGLGYLALAGLASARGMSGADIQAHSFSCVVVALVAMLVCNYAAVV